MSSTLMSSTRHARTLVISLVHPDEHDPGGPLVIRISAGRREFTVRALPAILADEAADTVRRWIYGRGRDDSMVGGDS